MAKVKCLFRTLCFVLGLMAIPWIFKYANSKPMPTDIRCCVDEIARNQDGSIKRSSQVLRDFKELYPCPTTGKSTGPCPGMAIDHWIPLFCKGRDVIENLTWMTLEMKIRRNAWAKDSWEIPYHCRGEIIHLAK